MLSWAMTVTPEIRGETRRERWMLKPPLTRLVPRLLRVSAEVLNLCRFRSSSILEFTPSFAAVSFPQRRGALFDVRGSSRRSNDCEVH